MRRYIVPVLLIALAASVTGCGLVLFSAVEPDARLNPKPGTYQEGISVGPVRSGGQEFYWSETPGATMSEFVWFDGVQVTGDRTFWYFTINDSGARSPIIEATYVIEDDSAPSVSDPVVSQTSPAYWTYGIVWNATDPGTSETPNPSDDVTPSGLLEYAVFSSASDNIGTVEEAVANGRVELTWRSWWELESLSSDPDSDLIVDRDRGRLGLRYAAGRPGERRFFNVFVRDSDGNTTGYGATRFASRSAQSIYVVDGSAATDRIQLNNAIDPGSPGGEPSFTSYAGSPFADGNAAFAFNDTLAVALGRIDGDELDDLAIVLSDGTDHRYRLYSALGNGRFNGDAPAVEFMAEAAFAVAKTIEIADFTGDGVPEFIMNTYDGSNFALRVFRRNGDLIVAPTAQARDFAVGDVTGDGLPDIVAWDFGIQIIEVWINSGGASLTHVTQSWTPPAGFVNAELADIDNDGKDDLLLSMPTGVPVEIYLGTATGDLFEVLGETWSRSDFTPITDATHVTPIDFNRDGHLDLFVGTSVGPSLQLNNGDGTFIGLFETSSLGATDAVVVDANGDGWPDIIEIFGGTAPKLWLNQEGMAVISAATGIGSTGTTMVAAGRLR